MVQNHRKHYVKIQEDGSEKEYAYYVIPNECLSGACTHAPNGDLYYCKKGCRDENDGGGVSCEWHIERHYRSHGITNQEDIARIMRQGKAPFQSKLFHPKQDRVQ